MTTPLRTNVTTIDEIRQSLEQVAGLNLARNNLIASAVPTTANDATEGYGKSSMWVVASGTNAGSVYICSDATIGAAVWVAVIIIVGGTSSAPISGVGVTNTIATWLDPNTLTYYDLKQTITDGGATTEFAADGNNLDIRTLTGGATMLLRTATGAADITLQAGGSGDINFNPGGDVKFTDLGDGFMKIATTVATVVSSIPVSDTDLIAGAGLDLTGDTLSVNVDGSTIVINVDTLEVGTVPQADITFSVTENVLAKGGAANTLDDSGLANSGGGTLQPVAAGTSLELAGTSGLVLINSNLVLNSFSSSGARELWFEDGNDATERYVKVKAPALLAADYTLTLPDDDGGASEFLQTDGAGVLTWATALTSVTAHDLLSATHSDTATTTVAQGDVMVGKTGPTWDRLLKGTSNQFFHMNVGATDVEWHTLVQADITDFDADLTAIADLSGTGFAVRTAPNTWTLIQHKFDATVAPGATDDSGSGYAVGSLWIDVTGDASYFCVDSTSTAAVWNSLSGGGGAPVGAEYVVLSTDATLTNERVLTAGEGIDFTDGGAGSTLTIDGEDATSGNKGIATFNVANFTVASGDVTIADQGVVYAEIQNVAANDVFLGNDDGAGSTVQELTVSEAKTLLNLTGTNSGDQNFYDTVSAQSITSAATAITATANSPYRLVTTDANYTLTAEPTIAAGVDGELILVKNVGSNTLTLQDVNVLGGSLIRMESDTETINAGGTMALAYDSTLGFWIKQYLLNPQDFTPSIASFTVDGQSSALTHEWGDGSTANDTAPSFVASYVGTPSAADAWLDGAPANAFSTPYLTLTGAQYFRSATAGGTRAFQLNATVAGQGGLTSNTVTITYRALNYCGGLALSTGISDAQILALSNSAMDTDAYDSYSSINGSGGNYMWFCCPAGYTDPNFVINSERAGFTKDSTSTFISLYLKSSSYDKFVSNIADMGNPLTLVTQSSIGGRSIHMGINTSSTTLTSTNILSLGQGLVDADASYTGWTTVTSGASDYIWVAYPTDYTDPFVKGSSGERAGFTVKQTAFVHQNQYGYTDPNGYDTMRSDIINMPDTTYDTQASQAPMLRYIGKAATTGPLSEATIEGLAQSDLTESGNGTFASIASIGTGDSIWFCVPNAISAPSNYGLAIGNGSSGYEQAKFTAATVVSVTNQYGAESDYKNIYSDVSELQAVTINATTNTTWSLKTQSGVFGRRLFMGPHTDSAISSANILTVDDTADGVSAVATTVTGSYVVTISTGEYLWFCHPSTMSNLFTIKDENPLAVAGSYQSDVTGHVTDTGETVTMKVWRSDNTGIFPSGQQVDVVSL